MLSHIFIICAIILIICVIILYIKRTNYKSYLLMVYPLMDKNRSYNEYKELYHSLGWYYRSFNSSNKNLVSILVVTGRRMGPKNLPKGPHEDMVDF